MCPIWFGWRVLGDASRESGQKRGEPPVVTYSVQLRPVDIFRDPPLASLYVETSTAQVPMGDQYLPRAARSSKPFEWQVDVDGVAYEFRAVRTANGLALAKGTVGDATVTIIAGNWPTEEPLHLATVEDLSPYIVE